MGKLEIEDPTPIIVSRWVGLALFDRGMSTQRLELVHSRTKEGLLHRWPRAIDVREIEFDLTK